jgi:hypothetical protein
MKMLYFISICFLLSQFFSLKINAQELDTIYFQSSFGICTRKIEIIDKSNNNISVLNKFEGKWRAAIPLVVNCNTDTIMIVVKRRFLFNKIKTHIRLVDIEKKYVYLFVYKNKIILEYSDRKQPGIF